MEPTKTLPTQCLSCGKPVSDRYCSACGEKVLKDDERTVAHFLHEALHAITHADGKFFKSLACILFKPGTLTVNYLIGKRKRYMSPLSIFVFANLLYLLFAPVDALNSKYYSQKAQVYGNMVERKYEDKMKARQWSEEHLSEKYDAKSGKLAKLLLILLVLFFSVPLALVYFKRDRFYVDHLVFATEVVNYLILVVLMILPWLLFLVLFAIHKISGAQIEVELNGNTGTLVLGTGLTAYLSVASHKVYQANWLRTILKSLLLFVGLCLCVVLYRFVLFNATMLML